MEAEPLVVRADLDEEHRIAFQLIEQALRVRNPQHGFDKSR
jgi:hypothetical protein